MISINTDEFKKLSEYIKKNYGINLREEKRALVNGRLQSVLIEHNFHSFTEYYEYLIHDKSGEASEVLLNHITTNHTFFMREPDHFYYFRDSVLPYLKTKVTDRDLRIWSAGCSSGEEPYTLAMLIDEFFGREKPLWDAKILATDISNRVLDKAKRGIYNNKDLVQLPTNWKLNYFKKIDASTSSISEQIKKEVIFRTLNLMLPAFSFRKKFHVIFCRNVMIYFNSETRDELARKFYNLIEDGGYLFIGHSETLNREKTDFKFIMPAVYRKE